MTDATTPKRVIVYANDNAKEPFTEWIYGFTGCGMSWGENVSLPVFPVCNKATMGIANRSGMELANCACSLAPAIEYILGSMGNNIVVLLCGGDKGSQNKDIQQAKAYWKEYLSHEQI